MTLASREPGRLNSRKTDIFRAIAHQISIALQNAKLFAARKQAEEALRESEREARHLARENAVLAEIGRVTILRQSRRLYDCWPLKGA